MAAEGSAGGESLETPSTLQPRHQIRNEAVVNTALAPSAASSAGLTAADRCDRCGAQAYLRVELQTGGELFFCAHHAREHGAKLKEIAVTVVDETEKLKGSPRSAPDPSAPDPDGNR